MRFLQGLGTVACMDLSWKCSAQKKKNPEEEKWDMWMKTTADVWSIVSMTMPHPLGGSNESKQEIICLHYLR